MDSEDELVAVVERAQLAGVIGCMVTDAGKTEFHGVPILTCAAIGPDTDEVLAPITADLKLP